MKKWYVFGLLFCHQVISQDDYYDDKFTESTRIDSPQPYFKILNKESKVDQIPLLMTTVDAHINGVVAEVEVTQYLKTTGLSRWRPICVSWINRSSGLSP